MCEVQSVFDKVIEAGLYSAKSGEYALMCNSLAQAKSRKVISFEEYNFARGEIVKYLGAFGSLAAFLDKKYLDYDFNSRLAIYKDWDNRPFKEKK